MILFSQSGSKSLSLKNHKESLLTLKTIMISVVLLLTSCTAKKNKDEGAQAQSVVAISSPAQNPYSSADDVLEIKGLCVDGATVNLSGSENASAQCQSGSFTFNVHKPAPGEYTFAISQTVTTGDVMSNSADVILVWTKTSPVINPPVISTPASNPYFSNTSAVSISGSCQDGNNISVTGDAIEAKDCLSGNFTLNVNKENDGIYNFNIVQISNSSLTASSNVTFQWIRDTQSPAAPAISSPSDNPYTSNGTSLVISGSCEEMATVSISGGMTDASACVSGAFSFTDNKSIDGTYNYSITQTDKAGNVSAPTSFQWIKSSNVPSPPTIISPSVATYSSNASSLTISGSCLVGHTVQLSGAQTAAMSCSGGAFAFTVNSAVDGVFNYSLLQKSGAGAESSSVALTWKRDTVAPSMLVLTAPGVSPYYSSSSNVSLSGTCEDGSTINVVGAQALSAICSGATFDLILSQVVDGNHEYNLVQTDAASNSSIAINFNWVRDTLVPAAPTVTSFVNPALNNLAQINIGGACETGTTVYISGDYLASATCVANAYSFTVNKNVDGEFNFSLNQKDLANNISSDTSVSWTRDTTSPSLVSLTSPSYSPFSSSGSTLDLNGSCETGATVYLSGDDTNSAQCVGGLFSFTIYKSVDQSYNFNIHQVDRATNASAAVSFNWVRDSSVPPAPTITVPSVTPYSSNTSTLTIAGTCVTGFLIEVSGSLNANAVCSGGVFSFLDAQTVDGSYSYSVLQRNNAGTASAVVAVSWNRDTSAPSAPVISTPSVSPIYSNESSLNVSGNCEVGAMVYISGDASSSLNCSSSTFAFNIPKTTDNSYTFSLYQVDPAGNTSGISTVNWNRDTVAPAVVSLSTPVTNPFYSGDTNLTLAGSCEALATISLSGDSVATAACSGLGQFSLLISKLTDGNYNFNIKQTDRAGNQSVALSFQWTRDTSVPSTPIVLSPNATPYYSNSNTISLSVACDANLNPADAVVNLLGDVSAAEVISPAGVLSQDCVTSPVVFTIQKNNDGSYNFQFNQENPNGNTTSASVGFNWVKDSVAPSAPVITSPSSSPLTAPGTLTLSGTCNIGHQINITGDLIDSMSCDSAGQFSFVDPKISDGIYNYSLTQTDLAGNVSSAVAFEWIRDSSSVQPPTINNPATASYTSNSSAITIAGNCTDGNIVSIGGDIVATEVLTPAGSLTQTCQNGSYSYFINKVADGTFNFTLMQSNNGVYSSAANLQWIKDSVAPLVTLSSTPANPHISQVINFAFSANEASIVYECKLDLESYSTCSSPKTYTGIANSSHTFYVRAKDSAQNISNEVSYTWTQAAYNAVALYHLDSTNPTLDSSLYTQNAAFVHNLTASGSPSNDNSGQFPVSAPSSRRFGTSMYYSTASTEALNTGTSTMTIEGFVKINSNITTANNYYTLVSKSGAAPNLGWELRLRKANGGKYSMDFVGSLDGTTSIVAKPGNSTWALSTGVWYYYAVTWNKGTVTFYWNSATAKGTGTIGTAGSAALYKSTAPLKIAANDSSGTGASMWFQGVLDELRISQIVRTISVPTGPYSAD